jgi:hypothetical protein
MEADRTSVQQLVLRQQLIDGGLTEEDIDSKSPAWEKALNKRYQALGTGDSDQMTILDKYDAVASRMDIPEHDLLELIEARAVAVKTYLVNEAGLAPDRAVITQSDLAAPENTFSGVELGL